MEDSIEKVFPDSQKALQQRSAKCFIPFPCLKQLCVPMQLSRFSLTYSNLVMCHYIFSIFSLLFIKSLFLAVWILEKEGEMEEQVEMVGRAFVDHYYNLFDNDRSSLSSLYQPISMLTFEGMKIHGVEDITKKLIELPFEQCHHVISTMDAQPSSVAGGILVFVSGSLQLEGEEHALRFSQMFQLIPTSDGRFFVLNDIFRLNYG